jgi:transglycosylase-like protein with SLT domain
LTERARPADTRATQIQNPDPGQGAFGRTRSYRRRRLLTALGILVVIDVIIATVVIIGFGVLDGSDETAPPVTRTVPAFVEPEKRHLVGAFTRAAKESHVPVALVEALAWRESRWRAEALNPASGATGIGQLLPATSTFVATELLHEPKLDPAIAVDNIRLTARYMRALIERFDGNTRLGVAAYLQGSTSVANSGVSSQTAAYLDDIAVLRKRFDAAARGHPGNAIDPLNR